MENLIEIKVCGMREPSNIVELVKLKPDYMGFIFYPKSPRFINVCPDIAIPSTIKKVGVFVNASEREIWSRKVQFGLDVIQLHGDESPELCYVLKQMGVEVIKVFRVDENFDFAVTRRYTDYVDYFLFDTATKAYGGSGEKFNWSILNGYDNARPVFLSGGIGPDDAEAVTTIKGLNIKAIDINSKFELEPGVKDIESLKAFITQVRSRKGIH